MRGCLECVVGSVCFVFGRECMSGGLVVCMAYHYDSTENEFLIEP